MAIFNVTARRDGGATITPPPANSFEISTLTADRCKPQHQIVDNRAYHDGGNRKFLPGDTVYSNVGLTTPYNSTGQTQDYSITTGFITLDENSVVVNSPCR